MIQAFNNLYLNFIKRIAPIILKMIFDDPANSIMYDRPLGISVSLYTIGKATAIAEMNLGGNVINIKLPELLQQYQNWLDMNNHIDLVVTDIIIGIVHEAFHINQWINPLELNNPKYVEQIEKANTYKADTWILNNIHKINGLIIMNSPLNFGLNINRLLYEANSFSGFADSYKIKTMEEAIHQKLALIFNQESYFRIIISDNIMLGFTDNHQIMLKVNGLYDCSVVIKCLPELNRLLYALGHGLDDIEGRLINGPNNSIKCEFNTSWDEVKLFSFDQLV